MAVPVINEEVEVRTVKSTAQDHRASDSNDSDAGWLAPDPRLSTATEEFLHLLNPALNLTQAENPGRQDFGKSRRGVRPCRSPSLLETESRFSPESQQDFSIPFLK